MAPVTLAFLQVWDRLEVGPVVVERRRLVMPYRIVRGEEVSETELVYRYGEDVFDPDEAASVNLASMIGAQVALNYGLFCKELVLHGPFDRVDRQLLRDMASNTAREIYVNKLLKDNPFLRPPASETPLVRLDDYLLAELRFPDPAPKPAGTPFGDGSRIAVLASGGKESLLSQGLLEELGLEVHALFGNESGRHWFTALNGFRHLEATRPDRTARVWLSSDRLFSWFLRHLPFVRPDFDRVRADDYPIRLWTVAVFLFGVLPLMRRRGIGRIVIGDEYDTTRRARHEGISHYDGLFDQSRFFDEALTRYFHRKGYKIAQFSLLRAVSETLVQRTLAQRYPELLACQVSCHAAHVGPAAAASGREGERVVPCGRCEKCRRVVGLLVAAGADPGVCGYPPEVVAGCLDALARRGAHHQEADELEHLLYQLVQQGHLEAATRARPHPEITRIRFHPVHSPPNHLPRDLRAPVYRLLLQHADGALIRKGRDWVPLDPVDDSAMHAPYPFESGEGDDDTIPAGRPSWLLAELTWPQARRRFAEVDTALLPVGAIEQHGPHLPLDVDAWDADHLCREVARRCTDPKPLVLPLVPYGVSYHHEEFPGTLSISPETLYRLVYEVGMSVTRYGVKKLVIVNGHGGNIPALQLAAQRINQDAHVFTAVDTGESSDAEMADLLETSNDAHAGEYETSTALASRPELVYMDRARADVPSFQSRYLDFGSDVGVSWFGRTSRITSSGVIGDPTKATVAKGERMWAIMIDNLVELVEHLKGAPLAELYKRRD